MNVCPQNDKITGGGGEILMNSFVADTSTLH